jgi:hypothetical protein
MSRTIVTKSLISDQLRPQREISAFIQTPLGTVKTRIEPGIKKLQ